MEETPEVQEDLGSGGKFKNWLQDNIRIILSVLIVVAIAAGIYSYSKRAETPIGQEEIAMEEIEQMEEEDAVTIIGEDADVDAEEMDAEDEEVVIIEEEEDIQTEDVRVSEDVSESQTSISEETDTAFIQTAVRGDSVTTLARKALRNYLEKSNDSSLTAEHKIYIEDYMRKQMNYSGGLQVDDKLTFSKTLIEEAIGQAKTLNDSQLENLKKYSARVSNI
jgi:hypothetical protein